LYGIHENRENYAVKKWREFILDYNFFKAINQLAGRYPFLDKVMILTSNRARYVYFIVLGLLFIMSGEKRKAAQNAIVAMVTAYLINLFIRTFSFKPRPFINHRVGILIPSKMDSSFPSKHTVLVFAVSTSLLFYNKTIGTILSALSLLTGLSRVWLGHHYPSDIIASAMIGSIISLIVERLSSFKKLLLSS
jgi:undecaprenyl-diphosphatase